MRLHLGTKAVRNANSTAAQFGGDGSAALLARPSDRRLRRRPTPRDTGRPPSGETVVLVHGFGANGVLIMSRMARRIARAGYNTVIWSYPSLRRTIERHGERFSKRLAALDADPRVARIHLVTHSMGSIVARCALRKSRPDKLGRLVMLAPPNLGSRIAAFWGPKLRWCVPVIDELAMRPDSFVSGLPQPEGIEIGVIAASMDPVIGTGNTYLACQRDHIVLPATHTLLVFRRRSADEVIHFLLAGRFSPIAHRNMQAADAGVSTALVGPMAECP
jgi:pimeloyl-ACP methyl ester carboxylesterase